MQTTVILSDSLLSIILIFSTNLIILHMDGITKGCFHFF